MCTVSTVTQVQTSGHVSHWLRHYKVSRVHNDGFYIRSYVQVATDCWLHDTIHVPRTYMYIQLEESRRVLLASWLFYTHSQLPVSANYIAVSFFWIRWCAVRLYFTAYFHFLPPMKGRRPQQHLWLATTRLAFRIPLFWPVWHKLNI